MKTSNDTTPVKNAKWQNPEDGIGISSGFVSNLLLLEEADRQRRIGDERRMKSLVQIPLTIKW